MKAWIAALAFAAAIAPAAAQVPPDVAEQLRKIGTTVNPPAVGKIYDPLLANAPKDGIKQSKDVAYGKNERHKLDVYEPAQAHTGAPVLIFVHGGGFSRGDKSGYENVGYYFARNGVVVLVASYRLAPKDMYPAGARDVGAMVKWAKANAAAHGGDPNKVFVMGHSAGAAHVAAYALDKRYQPKEGSGLAGAILVSGVYDPELEKMGGDAFKDADPVPRNDGYFGKDEKKYVSQAVLRNLSGAKLPLLIVYAALDPAMMQVEAGALYTALCRKNSACPGLLVLPDHDHISEASAINTSDTSLSAPVLRFVRGG